jgi:hypothetical protein
MPGFDSLDRVVRVPKVQQDQLIYSLKQQIEGLDQQTQGLLKDTLYRISRNANAAVTPPPPPQERSLMLVGEPGCYDPQRR